VVPGAIEIESPALVVTAVAVSLLLAGFALVAAIFDVREVFHQIAELRAIDEEAQADASTHRPASVCCGALSTRIATGWRLAGASWRVLRADESLMIFPVLGVAAAAVAYTGIISVGVGIADGVGVPLLVVPFLLAGVWGAAYWIVYFKVTLAAAARLSIDGRDTGLRDGMAVARTRRGVIARWAVLEVGLGLLVGAVGAALGGGGGGGGGSQVGSSILAAMAGAAWSVASFFVIPLFALEGLAPRAALSRSVDLVADHWSEAVSGRTGIGLAVFLVALVPLGALFAGADQLRHVSDAAQTAGSLVAVFAMLATIAFASMLGVIFRVELYRYATEGKLSGSFDRADVDAAFR
jgi:hypothetical protein